MVTYNSHKCEVSEPHMVGRALKKVREMVAKTKGRKTLRKTKKTLAEKAEEKPERVAHVEPMQVGYRSDVGMLRSLDEDSIVVMDCSSFHESRDLKRVFAIVADGMGGYSKGEVASYLATKAVSENLVPLLFKKNVEGREYEKALRAGFLEANQNIMEHALSHPECMGMGTTASAAVIDGAQLHVAHVGDTRVYIIRDEMAQVTKDHSLVQELLDKGEITPEEARNHPQKNVITRAIGVGSDVEVDVFSRALEDGDIVLLCCDGLVNEVEDREIMRIVLKSEKMQNACDELVGLANKRGGRDNISVIAVGPIKTPELEAGIEEVPTHPIVKPLELKTIPLSVSEAKWCENCGQRNEPSATRCFNCDTELEE